MASHNCRFQTFGLGLWGPCWEAKEVSWNFHGSSYSGDLFLIQRLEPHPLHMNVCLFSFSRCLLPSSSVVAMDVCRKNSLEKALGNQGCQSHASVFFSGRKWVMPDLECWSGVVKQPGDPQLFCYESLHLNLPRPTPIFWALLGPNTGLCLSE